MKLTYILIVLLGLFAYWLVDIGDNGHHIYTTSEQVAQELGDLTGRVAIVTGANSGIGWETARVLAQKGAKVIATARTQEKAQKTVEEIKSFCKDANLQLIPMELELSSLVSVEKFAASFLALDVPLHMLILNAGVMAIQERTTTAFGVESQMGVNHVAHYYLAKLLTKKLEESAPSRMISVSSLAEAFGSYPCLENANFECETYVPWTAYGNSKLANVLFAKEYQARYSAKGITAVSLHPGSISTNLGHHLTGIQSLGLRLGRFIMKNPSQGAATTIYAAASPEITEKNLGGTFLSNAHSSYTTRPLLIERDVERVYSKKFWEATEALLEKSLKFEKKN